MITKSQFALIAAIVAVGFASPALAQSFTPEFGTGNVQAFSYGPGNSHQSTIVIPPSQKRAAIETNGLHAFAMVLPRAGINTNSSALTGGGSTGYNELTLAH